VSASSKRELTLDKLRVSAQTLILQSKWDEVGVQDIAKMANVSIGTFYNYFENKDAALDDLKKTLSVVLYRDLNALLKVVVEPLDQLTLLIKYFFELINTKNVWARYLLGGTEFSDRLEPSLSRSLCPILQAGRNKGIFSVEVNRVVMEFIEKGLYGLLRQALEQQNNATDIANHCTELTLKMVGVPPRIAKQTSRRICPCTPLYALPISILSLEVTSNEYTDNYS